MGRGWWCFLGGVAAGVGVTLLVQNREKLTPAAARLAAKAMRLKEKTMACLEKGKEQAEDILAEARHINAAQEGQETDPA